MYIVLPYFTYLYITNTYTPHADPRGANFKNILESQCFSRQSSYVPIFAVEELMNSCIVYSKFISPKFQNAGQLS